MFPELSKYKKIALIIEWIALTVAVLVLPIVPQVYVLESFSPSGNSFIEDQRWVSVWQVLQDGCVTCTTEVVSGRNIAYLFVVAILYVALTYLLFSKYHDSVE